MGQAKAQTAQHPPDLLLEFNYRNTQNKTPMFFGFATPVLGPAFVTVQLFPKAKSKQGLNPCPSSLKGKANLCWEFIPKAQGSRIQATRSAPHTSDSLSGPPALVARHFHLLKSSWHGSFPFPSQHERFCSVNHHCGGTGNTLL